jgi:AAA family ATP:ADP antiporter
VQSPPAGPGERFLRLFTDIRSGESATALLLMSNIFLILTAYSIMKVLREELVLAAGGVDARVVSAAAQALLLLGAVPLYGAIAARVPRRRLINIVTGFFVACLVAFYALRVLGVSVGIVFFIWLGIFNVMVIAQFWSFANDVYTADEGKRLFPLVAFGATSGAVVGAWLPSWLTSLVGLSQLLLIAAAMLIVGAVITNIADLRERRRTELQTAPVGTTGSLPAATAQLRMATGEFKVPTEDYQQATGSYAAIKRIRPEDLAREREAAPASTGSAFQLVFRNRYLLLIALLVLLLNWVNTTGENIVAAFVEQARLAAATEAAAEQVSVRFYSGYQTVVNLIGMVLQLFVVSRALKYLGIGRSLLVLPLIAFAAYGLIAFVPLLAAVRWAKTAENSTDYSLNNTARQALFLPTTREEKYKGKQAVDSFFQRAGDVMAAVMWFGGTKLVGLAFNQLALVNLVLIAGWLVVAVAIGRRYRKLVAMADTAVMRLLSRVHQRR